MKIKIACWSNIIQKTSLPKIETGELIKNINGV